jgi:CAAX protease family protein
MTTEGPKLQEPTAESSSPPESTFSKRLRGFGPVGIVAILLVLFTGNVPVGIVGGMPFFLPLGAILVLVWVALSHTSWRDIGYVRPKSWIASVAVGLVLGIALKLLMKAVVMPLLGGPAVNPTYHFLAGNRAALPAVIWTMIVSAGFGEETVFRGFFFERLGKLFGSGAVAKTAIVLITATLFGLAHYSTQRLAGVEQAAVVGLVFGTIFARTGRIFMLMCAHAAFDLTALAMIYWDFESRVAHWVFR